MYPMLPSTPRCRVRLALVALVALVGVLLPHLASASNDFLWDRQYGPAQIQAPSAWTVTRGGDAIIAVIDSGVDVDHPDLRDKLIILPGSDFGDGDDDPDDDSETTDGAGSRVKGHGTHVAGTAAAITDNGIGVAGVAPSSPIMPIKVFGTSDQNLALVVTRITRAIRFAVDNGARVINLSVGTVQGVNVVGLLETPCTEALGRGALCIVAAGNGGNRPSGYDRDFNGVIVTANDENGRHAAFGQHADTKWAVSAPGVGIWSTWPVEEGEYAAIQGTSMATPHVAGVAALLFAQGLGAEEVAEQIVATADPMPEPRVNGAGRVNAARAVGAPVAAPQVPDEPTPTGGDDGAAGGGGGTPVGPGGGSDGSAGGQQGSGVDAPPVTLGDLGDDALGESDDLLFDLDQSETELAARDEGVEIDDRVVWIYLAGLAMLTAAISTWIVGRRSTTGI